MRYQCSDFHLNPLGTNHPAVIWARPPFITEYDIVPTKAIESKQDLTLAYSQSVAKPSAVI